MSNRILILDDDPASVDLLKAYLAGVADQILGITDPTLIVHVFEEFEPDILLLDIHMPQLDGLEILRRLRSVRDGMGFLPVVVLTADTGKIARNSALTLGADDFLTKPLDKWEVVLRVRNLLRTRRLYVQLVAASSGKAPPLSSG